MLKCINNVIIRYSVAVLFVFICLDTVDASSPGDSGASPHIERLPIERLMREIQARYAWDDKESVR